MKTVKTFDQHVEEAKINEAKSASVTITAEIHGDTGNQLFSVIRIDQDDVEDSMVELWRAKSVEDLKKKIEEEYIDYNNEDDEEEVKFAKQRFEEDWGYSVMPTLIGRI